MFDALLLLALLGEPSAEGEPAELQPTAPSEEPAEPAANPSPVPEPSALPEPPVLPEPSVPAEPSSEPPSPSGLDWYAPVGCPTAADLREGIERRLGRALSPGEARVQAQVIGQDGGYRLTLKTTAGAVTEERTLDADDCGTLADATALIVALAVDPVAVAGALQLWGTRESEIGVLPGEPTTTSPSRPSSRARTGGQSTPARGSGPGEDGTNPSPRTRGLAGGLLRLDGGVGLGALPGVTGALSLAGGLRWQRARLEMAGSYWIPRRSEPVDGARVRVQLGTASLRGCGVLAREQLEAPLCGGLAVGGMRGAGEDTTNAQVAQGLWLALEAGVGLSWWLTQRWGLAGGFSAAVPLVQPSFELAREPPVPLFEPATVAGRLWLGVEVRL